MALGQISEDEDRRKSKSQKHNLIISIIYVLKMSVKNHMKSNIFCDFPNSSLWRLQQMRK